MSAPKTPAERAELKRLARRILALPAKKRALMLKLVEFEIAKRSANTLSTDHHAPGARGRASPPQRFIGAR